MVEIDKNGSGVPTHLTQLDKEAFIYIALSNTRDQLIPVYEWVDMDTVQWDMPIQNNAVLQ